MSKVAIILVVYGSFLGAQVQIRPSRATVCPGDTQQFVSETTGVTWSVLAPPPGISISATGAVMVAAAAAPAIVTVMAASPAGGPGDGIAHLVIDPNVCRPENEARAIIGFEQAGASATKAEQHFFFDFFIDRKMPVNWFSIWGNVRVASYPQQISTPVAQFDLATQLGQVPVNQLAETAEFNAGIDIHPFKNWGVGGDTSRRFGIIAGVGGSGPFAPQSRLTLYTVPDATSPQYQQFTA